MSSFPKRELPTFHFNDDLIGGTDCSQRIFIKKTHEISGMPSNHEGLHTVSQEESGMYYTGGAENEECLGASGGPKKALTPGKKRESKQASSRFQIKREVQNDLPTHSSRLPNSICAPETG